MRDPMSWAVPLFRLFGIAVKVHILFFVVTLGFFLRQVMQENNPIWWFDVFLFVIVALFGIILLHEFGHCFGGRYVGGEANEILIWPLGGLAYVDAPHNPRAHMITVAAGPGVNVLICLATGLGMIAMGFWPNANPLANPFVSEVKNYRDGRNYTSEYGLRLYKPNSSEPVPTLFDQIKLQSEGSESPLRDRYAYTPEMATSITTLMNNATAGGVERAVAPTWIVWFNRIFWLSWVLFLFNLLPAYPLDGGQMLQGVIWARTGSYRQGTVVACYSGFVVSLLLLIVAIAWNESLILGLAVFMLVNSYMKMNSVDQDEGVFGYDFSQGYTSLERDDPPPRPKSGGIIKRWLTARQARKIARDQEERAREEERMDQLLDKIAKTGKQSLTDEERRFMERVSARYRNRS